jgi:hypothetical protein
MGLARPVATVAALALALTVTGSAVAADHRIPADNIGFTIDEADCGFAIDVGVVTDQEYFVKLRDNADGSTTIRVTGKLIESFTNTETGKTIVRRVGGPGTLTIGEDGGIFDSQGHGWIFLSPEEQARTGLPGLAFVTGHFVVPVDADISALGATLAGWYVDGCALLAGD